VTSALWMQVRFGCPPASEVTGGQNLGPDGVARNGLFLLERHAAVGPLDRLPTDGAWPAAQGHLALAHARVQREGAAHAKRAVKTRIDPTGHATARQMGVKFLVTST
jgi:hypothetical protein